MRTRPLQLLVFFSVLPAAAAWTVQRAEAHKPITSKYTYNDDVFPIFRERCSRCHVPGGVAPMSLMTYEDAFPWAESIRAELVAAHMPPATADDGFGAIRKAHTLTPREIDVILTWATGGNPRGALDQKLPAVTLEHKWALGKPDLELQLPAQFTLAADKMEDTQEYTIASGTTSPHWVRAADLLPGTPSIVRSALISVKGTPEEVLARWLPGEDPEPAEGAGAFRLPAGAEIVVRIRYKKTWQYEGKAVSDRSSIGLYYAPGQNEKELVTVPVTSNPLPAGPHQVVTFDGTVDGDVQAVAVSPEQVPNDVSLRVEAVRPDGSRTPLIKFMTRSDWSRRYWFEKPVSLPKGTKIEVVANTQDPDLIAAAFGGPPAAHGAQPSTIRLALDVVQEH